MTSDRIKLGIILVLASTLFTSAQDATFKFANADVSVWQLFVLRSAILIPILLLIAHFWRGNTGVIRGALKTWPCMRSLMFVFMYFCIYSVLPYMNMSTIAAGLYTAPLFVAALSPLLLQEQVNKRAILAISIGFAGVLVILQPGTDSFSWLTLVPVMGGLFYAFSAIITRKKCRNDAPTAMAVSLSLVLLLVSGSICLALYVFPPSAETLNISPFLFGPWIKLGAYEWGIVAIVTALMLGNGLVLPAAYQAAPTVIIATIDYSFMIWATLFGFALFGEVPSVATILGMVMIAGAGVLIAQHSRNS